MKKIPISFLLVMFVYIASAQNGDKKSSKQERKEAKREKINQMIRQAEEGVLIYSKQSIFGIQLRNNGYGAFYELGRMKTNSKTTIYRIDITEIKHIKEEKTQVGGNAFGFFGNPFIYGKINNFYQVTLGVGQQRMLGQKGNKNGVAISAIYNGGLAIGLLRPYYLQVQDSTGANITIKYKDNMNLFLDPSSINGGGGLGKGWGEMKIKPGAFVKVAIRFDYGRYNETVSGIEVGLSADFYASKIPILAQQKDKQLFMQGYIAILFGRRK